MKGICNIRLISQVMLWGVFLILNLPGQIKECRDVPSYSRQPEDRDVPACFAKLSHGWPMVFLDREVTTKANLFDTKILPPWMVLFNWKFTKDNDSSHFSAFSFAMNLFLWILLTIIVHLMYVWFDSLKKRRFATIRNLLVGTALLAMLLGFAVRQHDLYAKRELFTKEIQLAGGKFNHYTYPSLASKIVGEGNCPQFLRYPTWATFAYIKAEDIELALSRLSSFKNIEGVSLPAAYISRPAIEDLESLPVLKEVIAQARTKFDDSFLSSKLKKKTRFMGIGKTAPVGSKKSTE